MVQYNFKRITIVPSAKDFVDIVLSKTQRQTPTVIHKGSAVNRIRQFYMRKVKFTQQTWHERLSTIIDDFPRVDDIHPFYGDLLNVLYDKDHYKLALGQMNTARNLIDRIAKEYVRLLKYGDSLYRCKQLKKAALGRMCTLMRKQGPSLAYLEQVRQHMSRLPSIDPNTRTLLVCGYPNVGKSSFINSVTRADVDVQPYAFTTKSLFVGHTDYKYLRWQVIDTPGILDHPLEDRNTIEMLSITALAHLRACVMFVVDLSGTCGYTLPQQAALFGSIKPLFANKPLIIACNKTDLAPLESLPVEDLKVILSMAEEASRCGPGGMLLGGATPGGDPALQDAEGAAASAAAIEGMDDETAGLILKLRSHECIRLMSTVKEEGVAAVRNTACERLLQARVDVKLRSKKVGDVANRLHVAMPRARDHKERPPVIPQAVLDRRSVGTAPSDGRQLEVHLQEEGGGAGVYSSQMQKLYQLEDDSWRDDIVPEIMDGHNIADFVDPDILQRLEDLEREEEEMEAELMEGADGEMEEEEMGEEEAEALTAIRQKKKKMLADHRLRKSTAESRPMVPRKFDSKRQFDTKRMGRSLGAMGLDPTAAVLRARSASRTRVGRKRERSIGGEEGEEGMDVDSSKPLAKRMRSRSLSRSAKAALALEAQPGEGFKDTAQKKAAMKMGKTAVRQRNQQAKRGEADRQIVNLRPKHLFSGKRGIGKTDRR